MFGIATILAAALPMIPLDGVTGNALVAYADLDAYNVKAGDPLELTVTFIGDADFRSIHPPELSRYVDKKIWKVDDKSAKTDTYRNARRLIYRVRPVAEGAIEFPSLDFTYSDHRTGSNASVRTMPIPVHALKGAQAALSHLDDLNNALPQPDGIVIDLAASPWGSGAKLGEDGLFAWRKACSSGDAAAFKDFDFPEARLNEAACEILAGNWARALSIYSALEWSIGQTPAIERGIVAAIALKNSNPDAELPMWRRVLRPVLKCAWAGRLAWALGAVLSVVSFFFVLRVVLKLIVSLAIAFTLAGTANADPLDPFAMMEQMERRMQHMMRQGVGGSMMSVNGVEVGRPEVKMTVAVDKREITVGETFNLIVSLEAPEDCTLTGIRFGASRTVGLANAGESENLTQVPGSATNLVVRRTSLPLRYDAPFKGDVVFTVGGMCERSIRQGNFSSSFSSSFSASSNPISFNVKPLDGAAAPADYNGCIGPYFAASQQIDVREVETNDVVSITVTVRGENAFIPESAFDFVLAQDRRGLVFKRFYRADGSPATPDISFSYYDTDDKSFKRVTAKGVKLKYVTRKDRDVKDVVVNAGESGDGRLTLKFAPRSNAREIAFIAKNGRELVITESLGEWVRVDNGEHAGWVRRKELE